MIPDPNDPRGARAIARLERERIGWLTTVTPEGQPQTLPVWFVWQDDELVVYGDRRAKRNANLAANQRVTIHLDTSPGGGDVVSIEGLARIDADYPRIPANPAYLAKYGEWIDAQLGGPESMAAVYDRPIRIRPTRAVISSE